MSALRVAIVGCGRIGSKRAQALAPGDQLLACYDVDAQAAQALAGQFATHACATLAELLAMQPQVVIVATVHDRLAELAEQALCAGAHVLVEKPAGISSAQIDRLIDCSRSCGRLVKVGFNHRFHPGLQRVVAEVRSGEHGELMYLRARYGHGGRPGYEREWRADPARSGGGELIDQGMHLLDLSHWLAGPLPLHCALLRRHFWDAPVEDNAALILAEPGLCAGPWAMLHVSWTEWKNLFSIEVYCRRAKIQLDGLAGSYGPQRLRIYRMAPELGPPALKELSYPLKDVSWRAEWEHFAAAVRAAQGAGVRGAAQGAGVKAAQGAATSAALLGDLHDARYAWSQVEAAYALAESPSMQQTVSAR